MFDFAENISLNIDLFRGFLQLLFHLKSTY